MTKAEKEVNAILETYEALFPLAFSTKETIKSLMELAFLKGETSGIDRAIELRNGIMNPSLVGGEENKQTNAN